MERRLCFHQTCSGVCETRSPNSVSACFRTRGRGNFSSMSVLLSSHRIRCFSHRPHHSLLPLSHPLSVSGATVHLFLLFLLRLCVFKIKTAVLTVLFTGRTSQGESVTLSLSEQLFNSFHSFSRDFHYTFRDPLIRRTSLNMFTLFSTIFPRRSLILIVVLLILDENGFTRCKSLQESPSNQSSEVDASGMSAAADANEPEPEAPTDGSEPSTLLIESSLMPANGAKMNRREVTRGECQNKN